MALQTHFSNPCVGLEAGTEYEFRVIAKNQAGIFSEPSDSTGEIKCEDNMSMLVFLLALSQLPSKTLLI